jgi:hypothetical protein
VLLSMAVLLNYRVLVSVKMQKGGQHQNTSHRYVMVDDDNRSQQYCKRLAKQWRCNNACD